MIISCKNTIAHWDKSKFNNTCTNNNLFRNNIYFTAKNFEQLNNTASEKNVTSGLRQLYTAQKQFKKVVYSIRQYSSRTASAIGRKEKDAISLKLTKKILLI